MCRAKCALPLSACTKCVGLPSRLWLLGIMLMGWRGNLCLLSIPDVGHNLSKVQSQLLTASGQKFTGEMWWNLLLALPWLQEYLMALMCFYWGIWSRALLRNRCSLIYPFSQLSVLFWLVVFFYLDESQFNKTLLPAQFSRDWLSCTNGWFFSRMRKLFL